MASNYRKICTMYVSCLSLGVLGANQNTDGFGLETLIKTAKSSVMGGFFKKSRNGSSDAGNSQS